MLKGGGGLLKRPTFLGTVPHRLQECALYEFENRGWMVVGKLLTWIKIYPLLLERLELSGEGGDNSKGVLC